MLLSSPSTKIGSRRQIFQALLILDADGVAAELIGDAQRGDIHAALIENLCVRQIGFRIGAGLELHAFGIQPLANRQRFGSPAPRASRR